MIERRLWQGLPYIVYLPEAFLQNRPLPVLFLFRAWPDEWFNPKADSSRGRRSLFYVVNDLIQKHFLPPIAFVMPATSDEKTREYFFTSKIEYPELSHFGSNALNHQRFENEFLPHVCHTEGLDPDRVSIDGFSLGGYTALAYSMLSPNRYRSTGAFDPVILDYIHDSRLRTPDTSSDVTFEEMPYNFGPDPDETLFRQRNPLDLIQSASSLPENMFIMASNDRSVHSNLQGILKFQQMMQARGIPNRAPAALIHPESRHEWYWVDEYLYRSLPFHARILNQS